MRSLELLPPAPVWEKMSWLSIQDEWPAADWLRSKSKASGALAAAEMVPEARPSFSEMPYRAASPEGSRRARLISSSRSCSWAEIEALDIGVPFHLKAKPR